jgi:hypothetical protein
LPPHYISSLSFFTPSYIPYTMISEVSLSNQNPRTTEVAGTADNTGKSTTSRGPPSGGVTSKPDGSGFSGSSVRTAFSNAWASVVHKVNSIVGTVRSCLSGWWDTIRPCFRGPPTNAELAEAAQKSRLLCENTVSALNGLTHPTPSLQELQKVETILSDLARNGSHSKYGTARSAQDRGRDREHERAELLAQATGVLQSAMNSEYLRFLPDHNQGKSKDCRTCAVSGALSDLVRLHLGDLGDSNWGSQCSKVDFARRSAHPRCGE